MSAPASTCSRQSSYDCYQSTWGEQVQPEYNLERLLRKSEPQHRSPPPMSFVFLSTFPLLSALPSATALDTFKQQSLLVQPLSGRPRITTCVAYLFTRAQPRLPSDPSRLGPLLPHSTALELKAIGLTSQPPVRLLLPSLRLGTMCAAPAPTAIRRPLSGLQKVRVTPHPRSREQTLSGFL